MKKYGSLRKSAVLTAVACVGLMAVAAGSASAAPALTKTWTIGSTPANDDVALTAVSCSSGHNCMAVGTTSNYYGGTPVAYGWNGRAWESLPLPAGAGYLLGVACPSATYCIVVGQGANFLARAWSWDGSKWTDQYAYNPKATNNSLNAIKCAGPSSCEAVGGYDSLNDYPLAEYWNGSKWTDQSTHGAPAGSLDNVACQSVGDCEAVGENYATSAMLAMRLSGSKWVAQTTVTLPAAGEPYEFTGLSCYGAGGCTTVGYSAAGAVVAEVWNGSNWALQSAVGAGDPPTSVDTEWNSVHCANASRCTAVGAWDNGLRPFLTLVDTWNGRSWSMNTTPSPSSYGNELYALSCTRDGTVCMAVGGSQINPEGNKDVSLTMDN